jgi:hypothetical protein
MACQVRAAANVLSGPTVLRGTQANYRLESPADLQTYLDLLLAEQSAIEGSRFMTAVIRGAEAAILEGARDHARIEEREIEAVMSLPK